MQIRKIKYRPVSILSSLSKIYEKLMYITNFMNILIIYYFQVNVSSGKGIVLNIKVF